MRITAYMKSGNKITFDCDRFAIKRNETGDITGYSWEADNPVAKKLLDLDVKQIEGMVLDRDEATGKPDADKHPEEAGEEGPGTKNTV